MRQMLDSQCYKSRAQKCCLMVITDHFPREPSLSRFTCVTFITLLSRITHRTILSTVSFWSRGTHHTLWTLIINMMHV